MSHLKITLLLSVFLGQVITVAAAEPSRLPFDAYSGYFVSNKFEPAAPTSFLVITDQKQFDKVFGVAMVMGDKSHRLPEDLFKSQLILAAIRRGNAVWAFKVEDVRLKDDGAVELRYKADSQKSDTATFACPLIVSIPRGPYKSFTFVENQKTVKNLQKAMSGSR